MDFLVTFFLGQFVLSSAFEGEIRFNQSPVVGATISREVKWAFTQKTFIDKAVTDQNGLFKFQELTKQSFSTNWLPHEPNIRLTYTLEYNGKSYMIFPYDKGNYDAFGEFPEKYPHKLICDLVKKENSTDLEARCQLEKMTP